MSIHKSKVLYERNLLLNADLDLSEFFFSPKSLSDLALQVVADNIHILTDVDRIISSNIPSPYCTSPEGDHAYRHPSLNALQSLEATSTNANTSDTSPLLQLASDHVEAAPSCGCLHFIQSNPLHQNRIKLSSVQASRLLSLVVERYWEDPSFNRYMSLFHLCCMNLPKDVILRGTDQSTPISRSVFYPRKDALNFLVYFPLRHLELHEFSGNCVAELFTQVLAQCQSDHNSHLCHLVLRHCDLPPPAAMSSLTRVAPFLLCLDLSGTKLDDAGLATITAMTMRLKKLDISNSEVTDLRPLLPVAESLECLILHQVEFRQSTGLPFIVTHLRYLRELDISWSPDRHLHLDNISRKEELRAFVAQNSLPLIQKLDLAGNRLGMSAKDLRKFLDNHPHLRQLSISSWIQPRQVLDSDMEQVYRCCTSILIAGDEAATLLNTLQWHKERSGLVQYALHLVFEWTQDEKVDDPHLLQAVLHCMGRHMHQVSLILASTAVVYNLTRGQKAQRLPQYLLNWAVDATLKAVEEYPTHRQMLKNCFLTLCTDVILHKAKFSRIRCCMLVFEGLLHQSDTHVKRMGVAILSILAADLSPSELRDITRKEEHLRRLCELVAEKCLTREDLNCPAAQEHDYLKNLPRPAENAVIPQHDLVLRFTLSAIWNLTDECDLACTIFIRNGGLFVFERVFMNFENSGADHRVDVYGKCLGLLNNIAEFDTCRKALFREDLMKILLRLLDDDAIQIRYFVAGILAHLSLEEDELWNVPHVERDSALEQLSESVYKWENPDMDMVAYRSFRPFERLVTHPRVSLAAQHWCLWAICHVLMRRADRYIPLLRDCGKLSEFVREAATNEDEAPTWPSCSARCVSELARAIQAMLQAANHDTSHSLAH